MIRTALAVVSGAIVLAGCATDVSRPQPVAMATLNPTLGANARGTVTFTPQGNKVVVIANLSGLAPGPHGFHVHERGDCSAPDASSAGDHFNPDGRTHGPSHMENGHAGDLGNLIADNHGNAQTRMEISGVSLDKNDKNNVIGHSVIVHAGADDLVAQPSGNSGTRIACGTIALQ